ncbi:MAG: endo alpha-1,4 polygalactosaminidase, partial [Kiritimatiellae bacterium]|nr:endo alpha-1,4 polygalactosaminidase [Kiritimatiellia bacterium]
VDAAAPESAETAPAAAPGSGAARFAEGKSWCLYYGGPREDALAALRTYDIVIVDPAALGGEAKKFIASLKKAGCVVGGYLSMFEVASWHRYRPRIPREWYIVKDDGSPWSPWAGHDVGWDANLAASLAEPGWRAMLLDLVQSEVLDYGCEGVFMDTLEDLDFQTMPASQRDAQVEGLRKLMADIDARYPDAFFIGNRTLERALDAVADHADALCWEDFEPKHFENPGTRSWMEGIAKRVAKIAKKRPKSSPFRVLSLYNVDNPGPDISELQDKMRKNSAKYGYVPCCLVGGYDKVPAPNPDRR